MITRFINSSADVNEVVPFRLGWVCSVQSTHCAYRQGPLLYVNFHLELGKADA